MTHELIRWSSLFVGSLLASTLAAIAGFGGAAILLPILISLFGIRSAIPILTVAQLIGNGSRVWFNRGELDLKVVGWFAVGCVPAALLGAYLFAASPLSRLTKLMGVFLIAVVVWRHIRPRSSSRFPTSAFAGIGAGFSFLSALLGSVGPLMAPFFLAYGLVKGAYIGTEALATVMMHLTKLLGYRQALVLTRPDIEVGLALGPIMIFGSFLGKQILDRLEPTVFVVIIETVLVGAGIKFLL